MGKEFVNPVSIDQLETGLVGDLTRTFYKVWLDTSGRISDAYIPYFPHLLMLKAELVEGDVPPILNVGQETLMSEVFGAQWIEDRRDRVHREIDPAFRSFVADGYRRATLERTPQLDIISSTIPSPTGREDLHQYSRLIVPLQLKKGFWVLLSAAEDFTAPAGAVRRDRKGRSGSAPHTIPLPGSPEAVEPIAMRPPRDASNHISG